MLCARRRLCLLWSAVLLLLGGGLGQPAHAGSYGVQHFTFPDGTTALGDNTVLATTAGSGVAGVYSGALRLTQAAVGNTLSSFKLPDLDSGQVVTSFDVSFKVRMTQDGSNIPADGWAFNFGALPSDNGNGEIGFPMANGLAIGWDTYDNGNDPPSIEVFANGASVANSLQTFSFDTTFRTVVIHWDDSSGLTVTYNGVAIYTNLATPGFVPAAGNCVGFTARTGGATEDMYLDDLQVTTSPAVPIETGGPIISEFVANANDSYKDEDNDKSPWLEIYNGQNAPVNLAGYHLTDDSNTPGKWTFPSLTMAPYSYLIVFASSKNRTDPAGQLHTNFSLQKSGGYVSLGKPDGSAASAFTYGAQVTDIAYGEMGTNRTVGYLDPPTPLARNVAVQAPGPPAEAIVFPGDGPAGTGGIITAATTLPIAAPAAAGSTIRYTTSQVAPSAGSALYTSPLPIAGNTTVRARVLTPGMLPGPISSRTFIMLDASLTNYNQSSAPFRSNLPLVILDSFGIPVDSYTNAANRPYQDTYAVVITPDATGYAAITATPSYQGRSGTHVHGESSAEFLQKQYAWKLWDENQTGTDHPVMGLPSGDEWILYAPAVEKSLMRDFLVFETMRAFRPNDYSAPHDRFCEVLFNQSGGSSMSYANSYHGVFLLKEKIQIASNKLSFSKLNALTVSAPEVTGGYIFRKDKPDSGSTALNTTPMGIAGLESFDPDTLNTAQVSYLNGYLAQFEAALPPSSGGQPPYSYASFINSDSFIDAQWFVEWTKQVDGYIYSTYFNKDRNGLLQAGPPWDFNISLGNANYAEGQANAGNDGAAGQLPTGWDYDNVTNNSNSYGVGQLWYPRLHQDPAYHLRHWDRYWMLREGPLANAAILGLIDSTASLLTDGNPGTLITDATAPGIQNPAARHYAKYPRLAQYDWPNPSGYANRIYFDYPPPTSPSDAHYSDWATISEVGYLRNWLALRLAWLDDQNYAAGSTKIYRPPVFGIAGGHVSKGTSLSIVPYSGTAPSGFSYPSAPIYYTTDGSDPRGATGAPSGTKVAGPLSLSSSAQIQARMYDQGTWSPLASATFVVGAAAATAGNLAITEIMYHPSDPTPAEAAAGFSAKQFEYLELMNVSSEAVDLTGVQIAEAVTYTFGGANPIILPAGGRVVVASDLNGFQARYGSVAQGVIYGPFVGSLSNEGEEIELLAADGSMIEQFAYGVAEPWPVDASTGGYSLVLSRPGSSDSPASPASWSSSATTLGSPGFNEAVPFTGSLTGDTDNDGAPDFLEYAMGSDPSSAGSRPAYQATIAPYTVNGETKSYDQFTYRRNLLADGVVYTVELSQDLASWSSAAADVTYVSTHNNGNGTATVIVRSTQPVDALPNLYFRLQVGK